ncbi:hypothetical protein FQN50_009002 [Emmonsiellopsis sp. PD_5]|nr:hypothetical protein FQN50_009002 [Emmonsiellopsis sp. PD_5]
MPIYIKDSDSSGTPTEPRREAALQSTALEDATSEWKQSCSSENSQDRHEPDIKEESSTECAKDGPEPAHGSSSDKRQKIKRERGDNSKRTVADKERLEAKGSPNPSPLSESSQSTVIDPSRYPQATPTPERDLPAPEVTPTPQMASRYMYTTRARAAQQRQRIAARQPAGTPSLRRSRRIKGEPPEFPQGIAPPRRPRRKAIS